ncbi:predicted protein [Streptomyces viridosporus ATCC 14672]|uniref:Predicted protein n=1 Tax=Streptomyces viridosporus (strain ATCC 14672 / DSM 40746 / JCM 4963 / KCTC 9882 / NRRL B-12104 / FH 1290) TaxID=566461 RepID=D5ZT67_STRV1|nr:predicted protein [Streptomyces viridosporus ATCC 14672]
MIGIDPGPLLFFVVGWFFALNIMGFAHRTHRFASRRTPMIGAPVVFRIMGRIWIFVRGHLPRAGSAGLSAPGCAAAVRERRSGRAACRCAAEPLAGRRENRRELRERRIPPVTFRKGAVGIGAWVSPGRPGHGCGRSFVRRSGRADVDPVSTGALVIHKSA